MTIKVIVFDFDGTIAGTQDAIVRIINRLSEEFGYKPASQEELAQIRNLSSREIVKQSGISIFKIPFLLRRVKLELGKEITGLEPVQGIEQALFELRNQGNRLGIVTSNVKENVIAFLENNNLQELFDFIYSGTTLFGKQKVIMQLLKQNHLVPEAVVYIGDETRDIDAAKKSQVKVIAVSWGFNSQSALAKHQPDFLIDDPKKLVEVVQSLSK